jgi:hypothetical protein
MKLLEKWLPDDGFGDPVACIATSFTFDPDFFAADCLARFLTISTRDPEGSSGLDIAGLLEEEEKLATTQVSVLVDQSCQPNVRNLRWDLLPVRVPYALLHAKVAVLLWEKATRVIIGSANLTEAGYRRQVEVAVAFELDESCSVPRSVLRDLATELRDFVALSPGDPTRPGPHARALGTIALFEQRIDAAPLVDSNSRGTRFFLGSTGRGRSLLDGFPKVWSGMKPHSLTALSPFWDKDGASAGAKALFAPIERERDRGTPLTSTFVVPVHAQLGHETVLAPVDLAECAPPSIDHRVVAYGSSSDKSATDPDRRVHAKCLQYQSSDWIATAIGSSNMTRKGLGIDPRPHREINLWIGARLTSPEGKALKKLIPLGSEISDDAEWVTEDRDEDEPDVSPLHSAFLQALVVSPTQVELSFAVGDLPSEWRIVWARGGEGSIELMNNTTWTSRGLPAEVVIELEDSQRRLPTVLNVEWSTPTGLSRAIWIVNIADSSFLTSPIELRSLSVDVLLAVLASTRPLRQALEDELAKKVAGADKLADELDPLKRFDSSGFLLQRIRRSSAALWGIERRLNQRIHSIDSLEWRLSGTLGPEHIGQLLVESAGTDGRLHGETRFLLAELALTVSRIPWSMLAADESREDVHSRVRICLARLSELSESLSGKGQDDSLDSYVHDVFAEVTR